MRKIIVSMWVTLDGFIAGPNNDMAWVIADEAKETYEAELTGGGYVVAGTSDV